MKKTLLGTLIVAGLILVTIPAFAQAVTARTEKSSYRQDEEVRIIVKNDGTENVFSIAASSTPGASIEYIEHKNTSGEWEKLPVSCEWPECDRDFDVPVEIKAGQEAGFEWTPRSYQGKRYLKLKEGIYRLAISWQERNGVDPGKWVWQEVQTPEFQISNAAGSTAGIDLGKYFKGSTAGTFVLYDESTGAYTVFDEAQSHKRLTPCSTFKIYNSLAALETGVLDREDQKTFMKWDGTPYDFPGWSQDQTLASATKNSVVWYFQGLALRIGHERMQAFLDKIDYGNRDISGGLTTFWLRSSVKISAREQVELLYALYSGKLAVSPENVEVIKKNMTLSDNGSVRFMGKTGSGFQDGKWTLGWFVGCVENHGKRYFFATNIEAAEDANGLKAKEITISILQDLKIL